MSEADLRDPEVRRYISAVAYRILRGHREAGMLHEDLCQEGMLTFWQTEGRPTSYRLVAARNRMVDCVRSWLGREGTHRNRAHLESLDAPHDAGGDEPVYRADVLAAHDDVEASVEFREVIARIHSLGDRHREALTHHLRDELQEDVAARWGCTSARISQIRKEAVERVLAATG